MNRECKMIRLTNKIILKARNILHYSYTLEDFSLKNVAERVAVLQMLHTVGLWRNLVYALVLGTSGAILVSSSLTSPTKLIFLAIYSVLHFYIFWVSAKLDKIFYDFDSDDTFRMFQSYMPTRLRI